jgi:nucleoporin NDC1
MAFWELAFISQSFENRRRSIYQEIDRNGGSTWSQLLALSLNEVKSIQSRIHTFRNGPAPKTSTVPPSAVEYYEPVATQPKSDTNILSPSKPPASYRDLTRRKIDDYIKSKGSHPGAENPAKLLIERGAKEVIDRANIQPKVIRANASGYMAGFLRSPAGYPFRQTFPRLITSVVCGTPFSRSSIIIDAISAISKLAAQSITEDQPGQVQKDIPTLTRSLADALGEVEGFVASTAPHWTDVEFQENQRRSAPEVEAVIEALRTGIEDILLAFGEYFGSMGVSAQEVRRWRTLVGREQPAAPDMAESRT